MYADPSQQTFRLTPGWRLFYLLLPVCVFGTICLLPLLIILITTLARGGSIFSLMYWPVFILLGGGMIAGCLLVYLFVWFLWKTTRHVVTPDGIQFQFVDYSIYTPWSNVVGVAPRGFGAFHPPSLILKELAIKGSIEEGRQRGVATISYKWAGSRGFLLTAVPLIYTMPRRNWEASELGMAIRNYAPWLFNTDPTGSPDERRLRKTIRRKMLLAGVIHFLAVGVVFFLSDASLFIGGLVAEKIWLVLCAWFWLLSPWVALYLRAKFIKKQAQDVTRRFFSYFTIFFCLFLTLVYVLKLIYVCGWSADPVSTFIGEWVKTSSLIEITVVAVGSALFTILSNRFIAREQKQLAELEQL